jgi:hypothetical protein
MLVSFVKKTLYMARNNIKPQEFVDVAAECFKHPSYKSFWSPRRKRFVCPEAEKSERFDVSDELDDKGSNKSPINAQFKLVFITSALGTLLFIVLCVVLTLAAGREPPTLLQEIIRGLFDLAKIGFGAIVGLLGGQVLRDK